MNERKEPAEPEVDDLADAVPVEPCRPVKECTTPIKPGSANAAAAYRDGSEDEYSNRMSARYGGEW
jgi:hypothetical protein